VFGRSFQVARIGGIAVEIHPSWILIFVFLVWSLSDSFFPSQYEGWSAGTYWVLGFIASLALFLAVLVHEMAHAVVAKRRGLEVPKITLFIFGGVSHLARQPRTAGEEFAIAIAGPITSVLIAVSSGLAYIAVFDRQEQLEALFGYLALVNTLLALFNILPGFPLDGGRVLRSIAWRRTHSFRKATRQAGGIGELFGWLLVFIGVFTLFVSVWNGIWFMFVGWFLASAARAEIQNIQLDTILSSLTARDVMHEGYVTVIPGMDLQSAVDKYMVGQGERSLVVSLGDSVQGILTASDVNRVARPEWPHTPVQTAMTPREQVVTVDAAAPALEVLMLLGEKRLNQLPVLDEGRLVGLISRRELLDRVRLAEELATDTETPAD
jgi:Zn-dependent protease